MSEVIPNRIEPQKPSATVEAGRSRVARSRENENTASDVSQRYTGSAEDEVNIKSPVDRIAEWVQGLVDDSDLRPEKMAEVVIKRNIVDLDPKKPVRKVVEEFDFENQIREMKKQEESARVSEYMLSEQDIEGLAKALLSPASVA